MCGRLRVGMGCPQGWGLVGAGMCSGCWGGTEGPLAIMPSADQVPVKTSHSTMRWHKWVVLIAGSTGSALRAVRPPNLHITPDVRRDLRRGSCRLFSTFPGLCRHNGLSGGFFGSGLCIKKFRSWRLDFEARRRPGILHPEIPFPAAIPAGLAFARVVTERPDLNLYQPDKRHPTLIGTYLAAATTYSALTGRSSEDSTFTSGIDPEVAKYLRATAWHVTQEYYGGGKVVGSEAFMQ